jgi:hypothetical protein
VAGSCNFGTSFGTGNLYYGSYCRYGCIGRRVVETVNGKKAKKLRRMVAGDPDMDGRVFAKHENMSTWMLHPTSYRKQYQQMKKEAAR